jgi:acetyltransferase-like isoleucine patch superfamily enzyme
VILNQNATMPGIRSLLKNLLPKNVVSQIARRRFREFMSVGNSVMTNQFHLRLDRPLKGKKYVSVKDDCMLNCQIIFETEEGVVTFGNRVFIGNSQIICRSAVNFGSDIFIAWGCTFYDHDSHSLNYLDRQQDLKTQMEDFRKGLSFVHNKDWSKVKSRPITVKDNAWIGMNCLILKGVTIGEGAIVGAGSVVTKDVPDWTMVGGNPARVIKQLVKG